MKKKGSLKIVLIGFAVGVALLLVGSFAFTDKEKEADSGAAATVERIDAEEYKAAVRSEIELACLKIRGVRSAHVVVCFEGGGESIYAVNTQIGSSEKQEYVVIGSGSSSHALYLGESAPCVVGIGVICDTGGSDTAKSEIAAMLSAAYGLPLTRVYVAEGK